MIDYAIFAENQSSMPAINTDAHSGSRSGNANTKLIQNHAWAWIKIAFAQKWFDMVRARCVMCYRILFIAAVFVSE